MASDLKDKLHDLLLQATTERSHFYVASVCREAIARIQTLEQALREARSMLDWCASSHKPADADIMTVIGDIDEVLGEGK